MSSTTRETIVDVRVRTCGRAVTSTRAAFASLGTPLYARPGATNRVLVSCRPEEALFSELVQAESTHEIVQITKHGRPAAVLMSADDLESLHETLFWLQQPAVREDLAEGEREYENGETLSGEQLRARYGLPPR